MIFLLDVQIDCWVTLFLVAFATATDAPTVASHSAQKVLQPDNTVSNTTRSNEIKGGRQK